MRDISHHRASFRCGITGCGRPRQRLVRHTAQILRHARRRLGLFGCLLGYTRICDEMQDPDLVNLITRMSEREAMPLVTDPGVIDPFAFLHEVLGERYPNPFLQDTPQRIATDTSRKLAIRFGETLKAY